MQPRHEPEVVTAAFLAGVQAGRGRSSVGNHFEYQHPDLMTGWLDGFSVGRKIEEGLTAASGGLQASRST